LKRKALVLFIALTLAASSAFAANGSVKKKAGKKPVAAKTATNTETAEELKLLKQKLSAAENKMDSQQSQIDQLQQMLKQGIEAIQSQKTDVQSVSTQAASAKQEAAQANAQVAEVKTAIAASTETAKTTEKRVKDLEAPATIHFRGVTLTPGGFLEASFIARSRNENADVANSYGGAPLDGTSNANLTEFRGTARASRMTLLAVSKAGGTTLSGYYEMDFLGAGPSSNQVQTNAFYPRLRQAWGQAELPGGWTVAAGQYWTLLTSNRKGIALRSEFIPNVADGNYSVGFNFVRQTAVRVTKKFSPLTTAAFEVANPEQTYSASFVPANIQGLADDPNAAGGVLLSPYLKGYSAGQSTNVAPDLIAKVAFDPAFGHFELKAIGRIFRDRIASTANVPGDTNISYGGGIGFGATLPVVAKKVDVILEGLVGRGIGRYATGSMPDVTINPVTGKLLPLRAAHFMGGVEVHPNPKLDVYVYGGNEYTGRYDLSSLNGGATAGYGSRLTPYSNCRTNAEVSMNSCSGPNRDIYEVTGGFWYRFYKGPFGTLQYGNQFAYFHRSLWSGVGVAPTGNDAVGYSTIRFYLP